MRVAVSQRAEKSLVAVLLAAVREVAVLLVAVREVAPECKACVPSAKSQTTTNR